nr:putative late blight resistance protein homolog R1B-17 [Ipomoea batatas]
MIICEDINGVCQLPRGIWELPQLRHLQLYHQLIPMYTPEVAPAQVNLQTMYWLQCVQCTKQVLSRIPNIKELGIIAQGCISHHCLDDLNCLKKLDKLKVQGSYCPIQLQSCTFPENLKEITFAKTLMPWEAMNVISMLPKLEVLKLKNHACVGQDWKLTVEKGFPKLKLLLISVMDLKHWELEDDGEYTFQVLKRLVLRNCFELKEMPSWIENLSNLRSVQLEHCHASLVTSARIAKEQRENYGEYGFEIHEFHTQSEKDEDQKNTQVSLPLSHSFAEENTEDIKMSVFLKATSLHIPHADNSRYWRWARYSGHKVAVLLGVCWLEIKGKLDTRHLHKITSYSAYLIFKLGSEPKRLDTAFTSVRYIKDKRSCSENRRCQVFLAKMRSSEDPGRFPNRRHDGWMEIKLGDFYISSSNEDEVEMRLWSTENVHWKSGLIVKGIENHACVGQDWKLSVERGFPQLKVLLISVMELKHWELADVSSARMIEEEQRENYGEEYGFEILKFHTRSGLSLPCSNLFDLFSKMWYFISYFKNSTLDQVSLSLICRLLICRRE